jgi:hypothetical protein
MIPHERVRAKRQNQIESEDRGGDVCPPGMSIFATKNQKR